MKPIYLVPVLLLPVSSFADFALSRNGKRVECFMEDNVSIVLNEQRTKMKFVVEGESIGYESIEQYLSDSKTTVSYSTPSGTLTLSDSGDTFLPAGSDEVSPARCK